MAGRIKLLFLASTPAELSRLRVGAEAARIKEALKSSPAPNRFDFDENHAVRLDQLQQLVVDAAAQVVHFAGHGASTGELVFEDHDGNPRPANPAAIQKLFELAGEKTRLVVLNACYSHDQARAIADHVDVVIGTSAALADRAALAFSSELYRWLARGRSIGKAFELAKNHVSLQDLAGDRRDVAGDEQGLPGDHMPRIVHGSDVDPDKVFLTGREAVAARAMQPPVPGGSGSVIEKVRALVAADQLGDALELLGGEDAALTAQQLDELTLLQRQWTQIEREEGRGARASDLDASREALARGILQLVRDVDRPRPAPGPLRALDPDELRIRATYLKHTRRHLQNLMDESIHHARFLDLGISDAPIATHLPWMYKNPDSMRSFGSVEEAFRTYDRRLLLLGGPGAGKTVTLQHLALALIGEADADPAAPIPLIVNLSGFRFESSAAPPSALGRLMSGRKAPPSPDRSFEAWLTNELVERRVDRAVAQRWVAEGRIAAFLDGLDEVNDERRADLAALLNTTFLQDHPDSVVVVCSRIDDYRPLQDRVSTRLQLAGAVTLQPLEPAQIDAYLEAARASGLREALGRDNSLSELAQTPLTLSMMTLAYGGKSAAGIPSLPRVADQRHHLMESFVARMLQRKERRDRGIPFDDDPAKEIPAGRYRYHPDQVNRYLSWLAVRLSMRMQTACSLRKFFGFLALRAPVEESRLTSWIMRLSKTALLAIVMAVAAVALAPASRAGVIDSAAVLLVGCGLHAGILEATRWKQKTGDYDVLLAAGLCLFWWGAVSHCLLGVWPEATAMGLGLIVLTGAIAIGSALVAWLDGKRLVWLIPAGTVVGLALGVGAIHADVVQRSGDVLVASGMVSGQMIAILILVYRDANSRKEALQSIVGALALAFGVVVSQATTLRLIGALPWQLALGLVCASSTVMLWLLARPAALVLGLVLFVAGGSATGGPVLGILGGGAWIVGLTLLASIVGSSERLKQALERITLRVESASERAICTPAARLLVALPRILPWRLRSFIRYGGQALLLKPFSGEIEFVHRRLRDYFALRDLVPRLQDPDPYRRANTIDALGFQGVSAIDTLAELLTEGTIEERVAAVSALGRISAPEIAGHLMRAFADAEPRVRRAVITNLRHLNPVAIDTLARAAVADPDIGVVKAGIDAVSGAWPLFAREEGSRQLRDLLIRHIAATDAQTQDLVRHVAAKAPSRLAEEFGTALPALARPMVAALLADPDASVREMACRWMARNHEVTDVESLRATLQDSVAAVRTSAARALHLRGEARAMDASRHGR